jgi:hypothetical protein
MNLRREHQVNTLCLMQLQYWLGLIEFFLKEARFAT